MSLLSCTDTGVNSARTTDTVDGTGSPAAADVESKMDHDTTIEFLADSFAQLPERQIGVSEDSTVYAQYTQPTDRYSHGILGDAVEAGQLVVLKDGITHTHTLGEQYVFEDLRDRLVDVDGDGQVELVTIRTHVAKGAGIMVYKIEADSLREFAWVEEIGTPFRWLNIAAIYDLDGDGSIELAWIQTPHIGGILRVASISEGELAIIAEASRYSNHAIGESNLCLAVVAQAGNTATLYVPTQERSQIAGFQFTGDSFVSTETIEQQVDFSRSLGSQYEFTHAVQEGNNCDRP